MEKQIAILFFGLTANAYANQAMTQLKTLAPLKIGVVKNGELLQSVAGFGDEAGQVKMMNLMMVEGSGREGMNMEMAGAHATSSKESEVARLKLVAPEMVQVGRSVLQFSSVGDFQVDLKKDPVRAEISMSTMDMGTETELLSEKKPGVYELKVDFSMAGPWQIKLIFADQRAQRVPVEIGLNKK